MKPTKKPTKTPKICSSSHILTGVYEMGILDVVRVRLLEKKIHALMCRYISHSSVIWITCVFCEKCWLG